MHDRRDYTLAEQVADAVVHVLGLVVALAAGSVLLALALVHTAPDAFPALLVYVLTLVAVLGVSMAYNLWPRSPVKQHLARVDQAAIFLFIAGSYTPFLAVIGGTAAGSIMMSVVWGASLVGVALKLIVPERFGRMAILLYLAIGWSGVAVFPGAEPGTDLHDALAAAGRRHHLFGGHRLPSLGEAALPERPLACLRGGRREPHLWAVLDSMVLSRL